MSSLVDEARVLRFFSIPGVVKRSSWLYRTGKRGDLYVDFDLLVADPYRAEVVAQHYTDKIGAFLEKHPAHFLGFLEKARGGTVGAVTMAVRLCVTLSLPMVVIRPRKDIASERVKIPRGEHDESLDLMGRHVLIVTDHCTTGEEIVEAAHEIRYNGGEVAGAVAFTVNVPQLDRDLLEREKIILEYILPTQKAQEAAALA
jgi:orotate phosphoribosyltransferase